MKRIIIAVVVLAVSTTIGFAQSEKVNESPFTADINQLSKYLGLTASQYDEVKLINEYFLETQHEGVVAGPKYQDQKMYEAVYGNLKLMKDVLTPEQYRKYVMVLNATNNNNTSVDVTEMIDSYLADVAKKK